MAPREIELSRDQATDLGTLWTRAVNDYVCKTGANLSRMQTQNIGDIMNDATNQEEGFTLFRRKGDKSSKAREILGKHLGGMQKCMDGIQMVGNAAAVFPPAMPITIVFAACSRVLKVRYLFYSAMAYTDP